MLSSSNLLYPKEDPQQNVLVFECTNNCQGGTISDGTSLTYRNDLTNKVGETAGITQDIGQDPTVRASVSSCLSAHAPPSATLSSRVKMFPEFCTMCGQEILCEFCGQPNVRGVWLEVRDQADGSQATVLHAATAGDNEHGEYTGVFDDVDVDFYDEAMLSDPASDDDFGEYFIASDGVQPNNNSSPFKTISRPNHQTS